MRFINLGNEDNSSDLTVEEKNFEVANEMIAIADELHSYSIGKKIELALKTKVNKGEKLTDAEIYIATETIASLSEKNSAETFPGFGFESYEGQQLTADEISKIALEAVTNQNDGNASGIRAKLENMGNGMSDYFSWFSGDMARLKNDAEDVLKRVQAADENRFGKTEITDKRVSLAFQRGKKEKPFTNYKDVLKALEGNIDSLKVISSTSKYESFGSGEGSEFDLAKLAKDLEGKIIDRTSTSVTYDLNPQMLTGTALTVKIPNHSENGYIVRNLKANFVVSASSSTHLLTEKSHGVSVKPITKKESIELLKAVIDHVKEQEYLFKLYYKDAKVGLLDILKFMGKALVSNLLVAINSMVFRGRIQDLNSKIHYINRRTLRGLIALAASSLD